MGLFPVEPKIEYRIFDLTSLDISLLEIKKSHSDHCYITDGRSNFGGFVLSNMKDTRTICEVVFFPSSKNGLYIPRLTFSKIRPSNGETKDAQKPEKVRIAFTGKTEGVEEFWKMIGFL